MPQTKKERDEIVEAREEGKVPGEEPVPEGPALAHPEEPSESELAKADAKLPVYDAEAALPDGEKLPDTPSGYALKEVGNLDGEDVDPAHYHLANVHGEAYQAAKRKKRWGA
jgi:hypothetical protein